MCLNSSSSLAVWINHHTQTTFSVGSGYQVLLCALCDWVAVWKTWWRLGFHPSPGSWTASFELGVVVLLQELKVVWVGAVMSMRMLLASLASTTNACTSTNVQAEPKVYQAAPPPFQCLLVSDLWGSKKAHRSLRWHLALFLSSSFHLLYLSPWVTFALDTHDGLDENWNSYVSGRSAINYNVSSIVTIRRLQLKVKRKLCWCHKKHSSGIQPPDLLCPHISLTTQTSKYWLWTSGYSSARWSKSWDE